MAGIQQNQLRVVMFWVLVRGTKHDFISAVALVKLPRRLEQLEKFGNNSMVRRVCYNADHASFSFRVA